MSLEAWGEIYQHCLFNKGNNISTQGDGGVVIFLNIVSNYYGTPGNLKHVSEQAIANTCFRCQIFLRCKHNANVSIEGTTGLSMIEATIQK